MKFSKYQALCRYAVTHDFRIGCSHFQRFQPNITKEIKLSISKISVFFFGESFNLETGRKWMRAHLQFLGTGSYFLSGVKLGQEAVGWEMDSGRCKSLLFSLREEHLTSNLQGSSFCKGFSCRQLGRIRFCPICSSAL